MSAAGILTSKQALLQLRRLYLAEERAGQQQEELEMVLAILDTPAWTFRDYVLKEDAVDHERRNRLDRLALEMDRRWLIGRDSYTGPGGGGLYHGDAFWQCMEHNMLLTTHWLKVHQGRSCLYIRPTGGPHGLVAPPEAVYRAEAVVTEDVAQRETVPGAHNQAAVAFSLVALLYATFNIRVPARGTTPLWESLVTYGYTHGRDGQVHRPTLECLDVTVPATREERRTAHARSLPTRPWRDGYVGLNPINDVHELKANLRAGIFRIRRVIDDRDSAKHSWDAQPVMPWRTVLAELVGYVKHAQSRLRVKHEQMSYSPLTEMRRLAEAEVAGLRVVIEDLTRTRQEVTVTWLKDTLLADPGEEPRLQPERSMSAMVEMSALVQELRGMVHISNDASVRRGPSLSALLH
jgi:hypothetical protein